MNVAMGVADSGADGGTSCTVVGAFVRCPQYVYSPLHAVVATGAAPALPVSVSDVLSAAEPAS
jgi:hypothetical protein